MRHRLGSRQAACLPEIASRSPSRRVRHAFPELSDLAAQFAELVAHRSLPRQHQAGERDADGDHGDQFGGHVGSIAESASGGTLGGERPRGLLPTGDRWSDWTVEEMRAATLQALSDGDGRDFRESVAKGMSHAQIGEAQALSQEEFDARIPRR